MKLKLTMENILDFLQDENLSNPIKIKNQDNEENWCININDPFIDDNKLRLGIAQKRFKDGSKRIVFNGWKSVARLGDDYKGDFYKFVQLLKNFDNKQKAKDWFVNKYILRGNGLLKNLEREEEQHIYKQTEDACLYWSSYYEKLNPSKKVHLPYIEYLLKRKVPENKILNTKLFVDRKSKRIIFPVYENNELIFYAKKSIVPHYLSWIKSKNENIFPVWNLENVDGNIIYIFEGIFDAIQAQQGVALFGVGFGEEIKRKITDKNYEKYVVVMDNDQPGMDAKIKISTKLKNEGYNVYIYNYHGISESYKDFGEMAIAGIPFDLDNRIIKFDMKCETLLKLGRIR